MDESKNKRYWNEYQKDIADDKFFYERSCIRQTFFPGSEAAFLKIMKEELGKDIRDEANQHTCTGIGYHSDIVPLETTMTVVARLFSLMTDAGYENYVPSCVTSFGIFTEMVEMWKEHPEMLEKTRKYLKEATGRDFEAPKNIAHPSDIIYKYRFELKERMKYQLVNRFTGKPLRVVEHIGCHYAKIFPEKGIGKAEFPYVLAGMIEAWGGEVVDYPERRHCCGFGFRHYLLQENRGYSVANTKKKFESMEPFEPDFMWQTAQVVQCSWTNGSTPSPRWKTRPTTRTVMVFQFLPTRKWLECCLATTRGNSECSCIRFRWRICSTRLAFCTSQMRNIAVQMEKSSRRPKNQ